MTYSGMIYPGYSHIDQAMSVMSCFSSRAARISGLLILLHGLATFSAGYFPCDVGCNPESTSITQVLHGLSSLVILLTLLIAPAIWAFISKRELNLTWFGWLSAIAVLGQLVMMVPMAGVLATGIKLGLYQRIAYAIPLTWLFLFALVLIRDNSHRPISKFKGPVFGLTK